MKIKSTQRRILLALSTAMLLSVPAMAQESADETLHDERGNMTREQRRDAWNNMSDAERDQMRNKMRNNPQARERMKSMTPEQREQMRQRHRSGKPGGERGSKQQDN